MVSLNSTNPRPERRRQQQSVLPSPGRTWRRSNSSSSSIGGIISIKLLVYAVEVRQCSVVSVPVVCTCFVRLAVSNLRGDISRHEPARSSSSPTVGIAALGPAPDHESIA